MSCKSLSESRVFFAIITLSERYYNLIIHIVSIIFCFSEFGSTSPFSSMFHVLELIYFRIQFVTESALNGIQAMNVVSPFFAIYNQ